MTTISDTTDALRDVLAAFDACARGCALHADKCVGTTRDSWSKVLDDYDQARIEIERALSVLARYEAAPVADIDGARNNHELWILPAATKAGYYEGQRVRLVAAGEGDG